MLLVGRIKRGVNTEKKPNLVKYSKTPDPMGKGKGHKWPVSVLRKGRGERG